MSGVSIISQVQHYQKNIEKNINNEKKLLHCIEKLYTLPVTVQHLQETGVGRTINALRKYEGTVGDAAKALVAKWKTMVVDEESSGGDDDELCIPDFSEGHSNNSDSSSDKTLHDEKLRFSLRNSQTQDNSSKSKFKHRSSHHDQTTSDNLQTTNPISKNNDTNYDNLSKSDSTEFLQIKKNSKNNDENCKFKSKKKSSSSQGSKHEESTSKNTDNNSFDNNCTKLNNIREKSSVKPSSNEYDILSNCSSSRSSNRRKYRTSSDEKNSVPKKSEIPNSISQATTSKNKYANKEKSFKEENHKSKNDKSENFDNKNKVKNDHELNFSKKFVKKEKTNVTSGSSHSTESRKRKSEEKIKDYSKGKKSKRSTEIDSTNKIPKEKTEKINISGHEGIDCNSGTSFAEALGMCAGPPLRKKYQTIPGKSDGNNVISNKFNNVKTEAISPIHDELVDLLSPSVKLEPLEVDLASTLPEVNPNYKPLPLIPSSSVHRKHDGYDFHDIIYAKNTRTKVYSGNKSSYTSVPSLYELCIRVLIENIEALEFTGGVPYYIIKPVLERATADQLFMIEHYNPYLIEDTDELWKFHCNREFRNKDREEMESWREMYMRCLDEREAKLKMLTANIKQSIDKSLPVRSTIMAYVDDVVKPPRNVLKKQAKYATAKSEISDIKKKIITSSISTKVSVPAPPMSHARGMSSGIAKKHKAPLMAKALQLIKGRYKR